MCDISSVVTGLEIVFFPLGAIVFCILVTFSYFCFKKRGVLEALAFFGVVSLLLFVSVSLWLL